MVTIDGNKIQEVKDHYEKMADKAVYNAKKALKEGEELSEERIAQIRQRFQWDCESTINGILAAGPEKQFKNGFSLTTNGWREGYTKKLIKDRTTPRRAKNKRARQARKIQRLNK